MKIWQLDFDVENYEGFQIIDEDWSVVEQFDGRSLANTWNPIELKLIEEEPRLRSDAPYFVGVPVFSARAVELLEPLIHDCAEILPMKFAREDYFIINVTAILDCINMEQAEVVRFRSGRIMKFNKYAFIPEAIAGRNIFKLIEMPKQTIFVSDTFREKVLGAGELTGFKFNEVWSM